MRLCSKVLALVSALAAGASAASAGPQTPEADFNWVLVQGVRVGNPSALGLKSVTGLGLAGGQWLTPNLGWEASLVRNQVEAPAVKWQSLEEHLHGSFLWDPLPDPGFWRPFLRLGAGVSSGVYEAPLAARGTTPGLGLAAAQLATPNTPSTTTRLSLMAGAGVQTLIGTHGFAALEARALNIQVTPNQGRTETQVLLGVGYHWGQPAASPVSSTIDATVAPLPPTRPPSEEPLPRHPRHPVATRTPEPPAPPLPEASPNPDDRLRPSEPEITSTDLPVSRRIVLDETVLHFTNGGDRLAKEGERAVQEVAARLRRYRGKYRLDVVGHTSSTGTRGTNQRLSLKRAQAVARVLAASGIPASHIRSQGVGYDQPVASDKTARGQSRNRRVEILIRTQDPSVERKHLSTPLAEGRPARHAKHKPRSHRGS